MSEQGYPLFRAAGAPSELGRQHGDQAREKIQGFLDFLQRTLGLTRDELRRRAEVFEPLFRKHCPHLLEEVAGLAEGAAIHPGDALAIQLRGELAGVSEEACTAFALARSRTARGQLLIGQNSDNPPELIDYGYVLRLAPSCGPRILIWTFGGMIGYHGLNEHGVAHFANSLGGGPEWKFAIAHYPVKRLMLEQKNLAGVRRLLGDVAVCSNGNYVLCDGSGEIADIELTSDGPYEVVAGSSGCVVHSNHYLTPRFSSAENRARGLPDSEARQSRLQTMIDTQTSPLTIGDLQEYLSDHEGFPTGVCRHAHVGLDHPMLSSRGHTVASLIADPDSGCLYVTRGNPCQMPFVCYRLCDDH